LLWLALVLRRWHPGAAFPMHVQNWKTPSHLNWGGLEMTAVDCLSRRGRGLESGRSRQVLDQNILPSKPDCLDQVRYADLSLLIAVEAYSSRRA